jgi:hypothetical protein
MKISIVAFDDFTDFDLFILWDLLNRVEDESWQVKLLGRLVVILIELQMQSVSKKGRKLLLNSFERDFVQLKLDEFKNLLFARKAFFEFDNSSSCD